MIILVGFPIITSNDSHEVELCYQDKIKEHIFRVKNTTLSIQNFFFGYERYWLPSLIFLYSVLTIPHVGSILAPLR